MKSQKYTLDEMDIEFILGVQFELEKYFKDKSREVLINSSFLGRLSDDPEYVYHYDKSYWAVVIKSEYRDRMVTI